MKTYLRLLRSKHWIKNLLIFTPIAFSGRIFQYSAFSKVLEGFICFCLITSVVYIVNDIMDVESDRKHEEKRSRPIASGRISISTAWIVCVSLFVISIVIYFSFIGSVLPILMIMLYLLLNIAYSLGLKNIPLLDIIILSSGFLIRLLFGAFIIQQDISSWLYLTVMAVSFYLGLGKRRNEISKLGDNAEKVRGVLRHYTKEFLDKNMYMCLALTVVFYSLWTVDPITVARVSGNLLIWTVPIVIVILMKYSLLIESGSYADPIEVLTGSKLMILMVILYIIFMFVILYGRQVFGFIF